MADPKAPECGCRQPDCFACEIASLRTWLLQHGLHIVSEAERKVLECGCRQPDCFACEIASLRTWLLQHGLHIVSEAERKVPEACAKLEGPAVTTGAHLSFWPAMAKVCDAELARRSGT
jgi:hypothetical protein